MLPEIEQNQKDILEKYNKSIKEIKIKNNILKKIKTDLVNQLTQIDIENTDSIKEQIEYNKYILKYFKKQHVVTNYFVKDYKNFKKIINTNIKTYKQLEKQSNLINKKYDIFTKTSNSLTGVISATLGILGASGWATPFIAINEFFKNYLEKRKEKRLKELEYQKQLNEIFKMKKESVENDNIEGNNIKEEIAQKENIKNDNKLTNKKKIQKNIKKTFDEKYILQKDVDINNEKNKIKKDVDVNNEKNKIKKDIKKLKQIELKNTENVLFINKKAFNDTYKYLSIQSDFKKPQRKNTEINLNNKKDLFDKTEEYFIKLIKINTDILKELQKPSKDIEKWDESIKLSKQSVKMQKKSASFYPVIYARLKHFYDGLLAKENAKQEHAKWNKIIYLLEIIAGKEKYDEEKYKELDYVFPGYVKILQNWVETMRGKIVKIIGSTETGRKFLKKLEIKTEEMKDNVGKFIEKNDILNKFKKDIDNDVKGIKINLLKDKNLKIKQSPYQFNLLKNKKEESEGIKNIISNFFNNFKKEKQLQSPYQFNLLKTKKTEEKENNGIFGKFIGYFKNKDQKEKIFNVKTEKKKNNIFSNILGVLQGVGGKVGIIASAIGIFSKIFVGIIVPSFLLFVGFLNKIKKKFHLNYFNPIKLASRIFFPITNVFFAIYDAIKFFIKPFKKIIKNNIKSIFNEFISGFINIFKLFKKINFKSIFDKFIFGFKFFYKILKNIGEDIKSIFIYFFKFFDFKKILSRIIKGSKKIFLGIKKIYYKIFNFFKNIVLNILKFLNPLNILKSGYNFVSNIFNENNNNSFNKIDTKINRVEKLVKESNKNRQPIVIVNNISHNQNNAHNHYNYPVDYSPIK